MTTTRPRSPLSPLADVAHLRTIPAQTIVDGWQRTFGLDVRNEIPLGRDIELYRCEETELEFFTPVEAEGSPNLYARLQSFDWYYDPSKKIGDDASAARWEHEVALRELEGCGETLEVGCGRGDFLALARKAGLRVRGLEINSAAVRHGRQQGLEIADGNVLELAEREPETLDAVCSFQTLEHIAAPLPFLEAMVQLLKPGGRLIIAVPNGASYLRHLSTNWLDMPPHHMLHWSPRALRALAEILPLENATIRREPLAAYNVRGYVSSWRHRIRKTLGSGPARLLLNRYLAGSARGFLRLGLRRLVVGHSVYASFRRRSLAAR